jgi:uncharacterized repeat protein (TIGR03806 family)
LAYGLLAGGLLCQPIADAQKQTPPGGATTIASLPDGFSEQIVATGITGATAMAIAPDGRVFVCEQTGALRVVKDDKLLDEPFLTLAVDSSWERGLIGVTFDPGFPTRPYIYVCYVVAKPYPHHRVSRFTAKGDVAEAGSEVVLLSGDDQTKLGGSVPNGHQGGALHFGKDGKLYIGIGEQTAGLPAQKLDTLQGKLLRINPDGSIPDDNPFAKSATGKYRAIWAYGLRNPFAFAVQPGSGRIFINDVGEARWEEIDEGIAGANYGWPLAEGMSADPRYRNPIHAYDHGVGRCISGGTFYNPPHEQFPKEFVGKYFFADFMDNWIRTLDPERPKDVRLFATGLVGPVDMQVAPDGSLYYLNRNAWVKDDKFKPNTGSLHRISYTANSENPAPIFTAQPADQTVEIGQSATFTVAAKGDAPLRYQWLRGSVPIKDATSASYTLPAATMADQGANFRCVVSNARGSTKSQPAAIWVTSLRAAVDAGAVAHGLEFACYKGNWTTLPRFDELSAAKTGDVATIDLSPRSRDGHVGFTFQGFLDVAHDGAYTFFLKSSGASKLFVAGEEVVGLGFGPARREASGTIGLKAGRHPLLLLAAHGGGRPDLEVEYAGPGMAKQTIPASTLFRIDRSILAAPQVFPNGGAFTGPISVRLSTRTLGATIRYTTDGTEPALSSSLYQTPFVLDHSATILASAFHDGKIVRAAAAAVFKIEGKTPYGLQQREVVTTLQVPANPADLPPLLSQTGVFRSLMDLTPNPGVVPYNVNSPLWSDGAAKRRWIALPGDARIEFAPTGEWRFPPGTVFVKHFEMPTAGTPRRLETRLLVVGRSGSGYGVTYKWKPDQSDAELLVAGLTDETPLAASAGSVKLKWTYPSRTDCLFCHTANAGFVLGVKTRQLNGDFEFPGAGKAAGTRDNQLRSWNHVGMFRQIIPEADIQKYDRLASVADTSATLEHRVRSYLDSNCAHCHRPGGARGEFDARFDTPLSKQNLILGPVLSSNLGLAHATLIAPKDPASSMIFQRMKRRQDVFNMPPLATQTIDQQALAALEDWIMRLPK